MTASRKKLCEVCRESFSEDQLVNVGGRLECTTCANRSGVKTQDLSTRANDFGREIFRCLAREDVEAFQKLLLGADDVKAALGDHATADHAALMKQRADRDLKSKRAFFFVKGAAVSYVDFRLGPIEGGTREVQRYGRSTLRMKVDDRERALVIHHVYGVRGQLKIEFLE